MRTEKERAALLAQSPDDPDGQAWVQAEARSPEVPPGVPCGSRGPSTGPSAAALNRRWL